jgi:hypothetical protein
MGLIYFHKDMVSSNELEIDKMDQTTDKKLKGNY